MDEEAPHHHRTPTARQRLLRYLGVVLVLGLGSETALRGCESQWLAATHRARFKVELMRRQPVHEVVVLGSSRLEMAFSPAAFAASARNHGTDWSAFVAAIADTSMELLEYTCNEVSSRGTVRLALVELSEPQLRHAPLEWGPKAAPDNLEGQVANVLTQHLALLRLRNAFRLENVARLVLLSLFPQHFDGSEHSGLDYAKALWRTSAAPEIDNEGTWPLSVVERGSDSDTPVEQPELELQQLSHCVSALRQSGARVLFVVPPTRWARDSFERSSSFQNLALRIAVGTQTPVWDFAAAPTRDEFYRDWTHLLESGRVSFTHALTDALWAHGHLPQTEQR